MSVNNFSKWLAGVALTLAALTAAVPLSQAHAQAANCPLAVVGVGSPRGSVDGALLTRFALGIRGPALYNRLNAGLDLSDAEGNVGTTLARLDVDGDGAFTQVDATVLSRYLFGFSGNALTAGLAISSAATRKTGAEMQGFINGGCVAAAAVTSPQRDAARLLQQGTYGATLAEINRVAAITPSAWLDEQFAKPQSSYTTYANQVISENKTGAHGCTGTEQANGCKYAANVPAFHKHAFEGEDQLRQRVVNALWQTLVVSINNNVILDAGTALPNYWDMLGGHVFAAPSCPPTGGCVGSFRSIIKDMTLHPAMGIYLDMLGSTTEVPNENYARELLQLFSVGTVMLNLDGTPQFSGGNTLPTYDEATVQGFAKAFTGWSFANQNMATEPWRFYYPDTKWTEPMTEWSLRRTTQNGCWPLGTPNNPVGTFQCPVYANINDPARSLPPPHNTDSKKLLQYSGALYANLPAGQSAQTDLDNAVDNVFNHPNVGPFISRQLIQRMITSNPTPAYVARVASKFNDNGGGVRGDMKAVVKAILSDAEARDINVASAITFGKLREPVIKFLHLHRAFDGKALGGYYDVWDLSSPETLGQAAMKPPSVFNYYSPDFAPAGPMTYKNLFLQGPEFEITNTSTIAGFSDFSQWGVMIGFRYFDTPNGAAPSFIKPVEHARYLTGASALADNPQAMVDELDLLLTAGNLKPGFKAKLVEMATKTIRNLPPNYTQRDVDATRRDRFFGVMWQIIQSADYAVQR